MARLQASENALPVAAVLAASGGFLDGFTYQGHGHVFANAMTGNVVLLGVFGIGGQWRQGLRHLAPILAFLLGVAAAEVIHLPKFRAFLPTPALAALSAEMLFLFFAGATPAGFPDLPLVLSISFLAALQSSAFRKVDRWQFNSTMTTGNLRTVAESAFRMIFKSGDPEAEAKIRTFGAICLAFLGGALLGSGTVARIHNHALWVVDALLLAAWIPLMIARGSQAAPEKS